MKKTLLLLCVIFLSEYSFSQESKAYLGVSAGLALPGGASMEGIEDGIDFGFIHFGYRFNESWGATVNLNSSGHTIENSSDIAVGIGYWGIGPIYSLAINDNMVYDLKPQLALGMLAAYADDSGLISDFEIKGNGFVIGNSLVFGQTRGIKFSVNIDYLIGNWEKMVIDNLSYDWEDDLGYDPEISKLSVGIGIRYNF